MTEDRRVSLPPELAFLHRMSMKIGGTRGLVASLPGLAFTWESQARQYPERLPAGLHYYRGDELSGDPEDAANDCLLWYCTKRRLRGILNHYREAHPDTGELPGDFIVMVQPGFQHRGIGATLLTEAMERWPDIDLGSQKYTEEGLRLARHVLRHNGG